MTHPPLYVTVRFVGGPRDGETMAKTVPLATYFEFAVVGGIAGYLKVGEPGDAIMEYEYLGTRPWGVTPGMEP